MLYGPLRTTAAALYSVWSTPFGIDIDKKIPIDSVGVVGSIIYNHLKTYTPNKLAKWWRGDASHYRCCNVITIKGWYINVLSVNEGFCLKGSHSINLFLKTIFCSNPLCCWFDIIWFWNRIYVCFLKLRLIRNIARVLYNFFFENNYMYIN